MNRIKKITILFIVVLILSGCGSKKYKVNDELELKGTISSSEITKDGKKETINILNLDKPITINDNKIKRIELDMDKKLKDSSEVSIKGIIEDGKSSKLDFSYLFKVLDIDNVFSYVNTFTNDKFSMVIPSELIPITAITELDNGFIIYSASNKDNGGEVFRILSISIDEFNKLDKEEIELTEKIASNDTEIIVIVFPTTEEYSDTYKDEYIKIADSIPQIKKNIKMF